LLITYLLLLAQNIKFAVRDTDATAGTLFAQHYLKLSLFPTRHNDYLGLREIENAFPRGEKRTCQGAAHATGAVLCGY
jgi:hypothetical protein